MDGWKLVPVEPILAVADRIKFNCPNAAKELEQIIAASSAPEPPAGDVEVEVLAVREVMTAYENADAVHLSGTSNFCNVMAKHLNKAISTHVARITTERDALKAEVGRQRNLKMILAERVTNAEANCSVYRHERGTLQSELTKARELFEDMLKHTDGPGDFKWSVSMWFPAIRKLIAHQSAPAACWTSANQECPGDGVGACKKCLKAPVACMWTYSEDEFTWHTGCGQAWSFTEDGPKENGVKFCHSCGKHLETATATKGVCDE